MGIEIIDFKKEKEDIVGSCAICGGAGVIDEKKCSCLERFESHVFYHFRGIPKMFWDSTFADYKRDSVTLGMCTAYVDNCDIAKEKGLGFLLLGNRGNGKTLLAGCMLKEIFKRGHSILFRNVYEMKKGDDGVLSVDFLCLDNLVPELYARDIMPYIEYVVYTRIHNLKPIIITAHYSEEEFKNNFKNIYSFLISKCKVVSFLGSDYRDNLQNSWDSELRNK